jgi:hypothetical protein
MCGALTSAKLRRSIDEKSPGPHPFAPPATFRRRWGVGRASPSRTSTNASRMTRVTRDTRHAPLSTTATPAPAQRIVPRGTIHFFARSCHSGVAGPAQTAGTAAGGRDRPTRQRRGDAGEGCASGWGACTLSAHGGARAVMARRCKHGRRWRARARARRGLRTPTGARNTRRPSEDRAPRRARLANAEGACTPRAMAARAPMAREPSTSSIEPRAAFGSESRCR